MAFMHLHRMPFVPLHGEATWSLAWAKLVLRAISRPLNSSIPRPDVGAPMLKEDQAEWGCLVDCSGNILQETALTNLPEYLRIAYSASYRLQPDIVRSALVSRFSLDAGICNVW